MPKFSVIMNCLNGERFLREAINSVFEQSFEDWELIFFDSGSIDRSVEIATSFGQKVKIFVLDKPIPLGQARQEAIDRASGDFLAFLDVDDVWLPTKLQTQYLAMAKGDYDICYSAVQCIDENGVDLYKIFPIHDTGPLFEKLLRHVEGSWCTYVVRRNALLNKGIKFNPLLRSSCEEDLILNLLACDGTGVVISSILAKYRIVSGSVTSFYSDRLASERFSTINRLIRENPGIRLEYSRAFDEAEARGFYYNACHLFNTGNYNEASKAISKAVSLNSKYKILKLLIKYPAVWRLLHRLKGHLAPAFIHYLYH